MRGKAFSVGDPAQSSARFRGIPVAKNWQHLSGRTFLVEELPVQEIGPQLEQLPVPAHAGAAMNPPNAAPHKASATRRLPPAHLVQADTNAVQLAKADLQKTPGLVLDYQEIDFDQPDFTFQSGVTYYVPSQINLFGTTTFEGGSVIKFDEQNGGFQIYSSINNQSDPAHPTVLTSVNDDSVGVIIPGSSGQPEQCMTDPMDVYTNYIELKNFRFNHAEINFFNFTEASTNIFWNCEFNDCGEPIDLTYGKVVLRNVLNFGVFFCGQGQNGNAGSGEWYWLDAQNVTSDFGTWSGWGYVFYPDAAQHITLVLTNCILVGAGDELASVAGMVKIRDAYTTYGAAAVATNAAFESCGNANYYLATNSPLRNVGTTNIDPDLLAELRQMTTYAPQDGGYLDTNAPDLGYHYPVNEDSDYDGLPDWWELKYFGNLTHTGSELDASGNTLLYDYQNGIDPNIIQFTIEVANNYVNTSYPSLQLNVTAGVPSYYAVLVDSTNFATTNWMACSSSSITANLGTIQSWHEIWVGLRGLPPDARQSWQWKRLKLDMTSPQLVITGPTNGTVNVPMIQLTGYSPEALGSISYDLTNAVGLVTNQQVLVLNQFYSTNTWQFTTNTFQAFDIPLTNGVNTITLHATDLAGNVTTLATNFTLDYSSKTNPPVVTLYWPQDGTLVCNNNYTWRGLVDDPTATVTAQWVDTNGNTNIFYGIVERSGNFWVENVPLSGGTNYLTLTVADVVGNVTVTNITVMPGAVGLTITMPDASQLWNQGITVNGTISDSNDYTVWVNGAKATLNDGTWTATNVFLPQGGTAVIQARAIPNSNNGGNGTGGNGGGPVTYDNLGNPDPPQDNDTEIQTNRPPRLYLKSYDIPAQHSDIDVTLPCDGGSGNYHYVGISDYTQHFSDGQGGNFSIQYSESANYCDGIWWHWYGGGTVNWPSNGTPETSTGSSTIDGSDPDGNGSTTWNEIDDPTYYPPTPNEHCDVKLGFIDPCDGPQYVWTLDIIDPPGDWIVNYNRSAETKWYLQTGGKGTRQNLWGFSASASEVLDKAVPLVDPNLDGGFPGSPMGPIPAGNIKIMGKPLGNDGNLWTTLRDNIPDLDVTPYVAGKDYYTFTVGAQKYIPYITDNGVTLDPNQVNVTNCVGQKITFGASWDRTPPGLLNNLTTYIWTPSSKYVNHSTHPCNSCSVNYDIDLSLLDVAEPYVWYVSGGDKDVYAHLFLHFDNGQSATVSASGKFSMYRPNVVMVDPHQHGTPTVIWERPWSLIPPGGAIQLGVQGGANNMSYLCRIISSDFDGMAKITQICNINATGLSGSCSGCLDGSDPYNGLGIEGQECSVRVNKNPNPTGSANEMNLDDAPDANDLYVLRTISMNDSFIDYVMFNPDPSDDGIYVTLAKITWDVSASVTYADTNITQNADKGPHKPTDSDEFPIWTTTR